MAPVGVIIGAGILVYMGMMLRNSTAQKRGIALYELANVEKTVNEERVEIATMEDQVSQLEAQWPPWKPGRTSLILHSPLWETSVRLSDDIERYVKLLPGTIYLTTDNDDGDLVTVSGRAPSEDDIFVYAEDLAIKFGDVIVSSIELVEDEVGEITGYDFKLLIH